MDNMSIRILIEKIK